MIYNYGMSEKEKESLDEKEVKAESEGAKEEEKKAEVAPYSVFGTDMVVDQKEFISFYKYRMKMMIMKYKLVGHIDESGKYVIREEIRRDLVRMEKEIDDMGDNYYKAIALYMKKHFYYTVKIQLQDDGTAKASLYLSEYVDNFLGNEYIVTHIADFVAIYDDEFRVKLRKAFHLVDVGTKVDDTAVPELAVIMQDGFDFELIAGSLYDMACQIYLMNMLKLLEESGPAGKKILAQYRALLGKNNVEVNEKFRYIAYKSLLDRVIDGMGGFNKLGIEPAKVLAVVNDLNKTLLQVDKASSRGPLEMQNTSSDAKKAKLGGGKTSSKGNKSSTKATSVAKPTKAKPKAKAEATKSGGVTLGESTPSKESGVVELSVETGKGGFSRHEPPREVFGKDKGFGGIKDPNALSGKPRPQEREPQEPDNKFDFEKALSDDDEDMAVEEIKDSKDMDVEEIQQPEDEKMNTEEIERSNSEEMDVEKI